jgi:outer membrane immunogenic protein
MNKHISKIAMATLGLFMGASANSVKSADVYNPVTPDIPGVTFTPDNNWQGPYIGIHGGFSRGHWDGKLETTAGDPVDNYAGYDNPFKSIEGEGWNAGAQIGFNYQVEKLVLGAEIDASWTNHEGSKTFVTDDYNGDYAKEHSFSLDYFGTARVRAGYDMGFLMPYLTGGLAFGHSEGNLSISYPNAPALAGMTSNASASQHHLGWTIGAGIEAKLGNNWSIKAEYLHMDLGRKDYDFKGEVFNGAPFNTDSFDNDLTMDVIRIGLNRRF